MSTPSGDLGTGRLRGTSAASTGFNPAPATVITSELPVTAAPPHVSSPYGGGGFDPRRMPAPIAVRLLVWLLFFVLLFALLGLSVVYLHPTWVSFLRNSSKAPAPGASIPAALSPSPSTTPSANGNATFRLESTGASGATYQVPRGTYTIVVTVLHNSWIEVKSPPSAPHPVFAKTVSTSTKSASIPVTGSATVVTGTRVASIGITVNSKSVGTISAPRSEYTYTFVPPHS